MINDFITDIIDVDKFIDMLKTNLPQIQIEEIDCYEEEGRYSDFIEIDFSMDGTINNQKVSFGDNRLYYDFSDNQYKLNTEHSYFDEEFIMTLMKNDGITTEEIDKNEFESMDEFKKACEEYAKKLKDYEITHIFSNLPSITDFLNPSIRFLMNMEKIISEYAMVSYVRDNIFYMVKNKPNDKFIELYKFNDDEFTIYIQLLDNNENYFRTREYEIHASLTEVKILINDVLNNLKDTTFKDCEIYKLLQQIVTKL